MNQQRRFVCVAMLAGYVGGFIGPLSVWASLAMLWFSLASMLLAGELPKKYGLAWMLAALAGMVSFLSIGLAMGLGIMVVFVAISMYFKILIFR